MTDCPRAGRWFGRSCRFEARYDTAGQDTAFQLQLAVSIGNAELAKIIAGTANYRTYVRDVCVTCGKTIERNPSK